MIPLFELYPGLKKGLPHIPLATLPTPVEPLEKVRERFGIGRLFIKRDDVSGEPYGGNKIRKLEFLLGDALKAEAGSVITFGAGGSNHALATAVYARRLGLESISVLIPQHNARYVGRNLLLSRRFGARLFHFPDREAHARGAREIIAKYTGETGRPPYRIPFGGTTPLGTAGFVNAVLELKNQVEAGLLEEPDYIYVALGSMGTAAGLALGIRAAGLRTVVRAVRVVAQEIANESKCADLISKTSELFSGIAEDFPRISDPLGNIIIEHDYFGSEYALFTEKGQEAIKLLSSLEGIKLDGTYTGKAFAALLSHAAGGRLNNKSVLFWNTLNSRETDAHIQNEDYHDLPPEFHHYFTDAFQPLELPEVRFRE